MAKDYILEKRKFVIGGIAISIVLIYLIRLFVLQITTDDYKKNADSNAFLNKIQYPSRGAIYDRTHSFYLGRLRVWDSGKSRGDGKEHIRGERGRKKAVSVSSPWIYAEKS